MTLYVLIACEESQAECSAFRAHGHVAYSCDVQKHRRGGRSDWHIRGDVSPYLDGRTDFVTQDGVSRTVPRWDLIIAHPPCTYLCKIGSQWLHKEPLSTCQTPLGELQLNRRRYNMLLRAREFFFKCLSAKADYVAVENPLPMRLANLPEPTTYACPSWYGVRYSKKTLYWLKNLPPLMPEFVYPFPKSYVDSSRGKYRSRTFPQLADAIARQWGDYIAQDREKHHA